LCGAEKCRSTAKDGVVAPAPSSFLLVLLLKRSAVGIELVARPIAQGPTIAELVARRKPSLWSWLGIGFC